MNKEVGILSLSYGNYVSLEDYMKLRNNWNELKEWLKEYHKIMQHQPDSYDEVILDVLQETIDIMQEIESRK